MGAFFTNVQVRAGDARAVADAIRADASELDELGPESDAEPDRTVLVLPAKDGWIAIYDEATEGQDAGSLERLAAAASRIGPAFSVLIHDSDVLDLRLYEAGARVDRLDSDPGYFGGEGISKRKRAELGGDPARWSALGDPGRLREAWSARDLFAERMLARTCEIVGCDVRRASTGYRYTVKDGDAIPDGTITLRFRARARPAWESESRDEPELVTESYVEGEIALAIGDELRVSLGARSAGRASTGLGVRVWGTAIERGLVEIERFEVVVGSVKDGARHQSIAPERTRSKDGAALLVADLVAQRIPAGSAEPGGLTPGMDFMRAIEAMQRSKVHVNVVGRVVAAGKGELGIGLVPLERAAASAATIARLAIDPPFPRPLRMPADPVVFGGNVSHLLRPLAGDRYLLAMAAIDGPRAELARWAREVLERVRDVLSDTDPVSTTIYFTEPATRPKTGAGKVKTMLRGARLDALMSAVETEQSVILTAGPISLAAGTSVLPDREEDRTPWLALTVDAAGREVAPLRERLTATLDAIMRAHGVQAVLARTGWAANAPVDSTPYEQACGIAHGVGTLREWTARWVRMPGNDRLWLGPALASRVDREALAAIAAVEPVGEVLRITLRDRAEWSALERAIADLLPTAEESQRAVMAWHRRRASSDEA